MKSYTYILKDLLKLGIDVDTAVDKACDYTSTGDHAPVSQPVVTTAAPQSAPLPTSAVTPAAPPRAVKIETGNQYELNPDYTGDCERKPNTARGMVRSLLVGGKRTYSEICAALDASEKYRGHGRRAIRDLVGMGQVRECGQAMLPLTAPKTPRPVQS